MKCKCCDNYWHELSEYDNLTNGDIFELVNIHSGGFNMVHKEDVDKLSDDGCYKKKINKLLKMGLIEVDEYGVYVITKKAFDEILIKEIEK